VAFLQAKTVVPLFLWPRQGVVPVLQRATWAASLAEPLLLYRNWGVQPRWTGQIQAGRGGRLVELGVHARASRARCRAPTARKGEASSPIGFLFAAPPHPSSKQMPL
jgi:hypothetical protein